MLNEVIDDLQKALSATKIVEAKENFASATIEEDAPVEKPEIERRSKPKH